MFKQTKEGNHLLLTHGFSVYLMNTPESSVLPSVGECLCYMIFIGLPLAIVIRLKYTFKLCYTSIMHL